MNNQDKPICYPFMAGFLQATLKDLPSRNLPGIKIEITDLVAYQAAIQKLVQEAEELSKELS